ncbi:MAG: hypothetical protein O7D29_05500, partial [Gemmatimonadetes bacterium]|nr:hypothetical protein [Gemmatimonadota bacterium]
DGLERIHHGDTVLPRGISHRLTPMDTDGFGWKQSRIGQAKPDLRLWEVANPPMAGSGSL